MMTPEDDDPQKDSTIAPPVLWDPRPFEFTERAIPVDRTKLAIPIAFEPFPAHPTDAIALDDAGALHRLNLATGETRRLRTLTREELRWDQPVQIVISRDGCYAALTSAGTIESGDSYNRGVVVDLESGRTAMALDCGDYRTHHALFAVAFVEREGRTLVIHATDWNRVDVTDPSTGECLTSRKLDSEDSPGPASEESVFTEWLGELKVSPDQSRVATIGWVWHPVGLAFGWSVRDWLDSNPHEPDHGRSKRQYAMWSYFWFSPFFWYDDSTLCIWGDPELSGADDVPPNSVVLYDAESGKALRSIPGPSMNGFHFDRYLFTEDEEKGLSVWDLERGALVHEEPGIQARGYHPGLAEFIETSVDGWVGWSWREL
jgi:hypothetical protein